MPENHHASFTLDALRPVGLHPGHVHGWRRPSAVRPALAGRRLRDGLVVRAVEHAGPRVVDVDVKGWPCTGTTVRRTAAHLVSRSSRTGSEGSLAGRWDVRRRDDRPDRAPPTQAGDRDLPIGREPTTAAPAPRPNAPTSRTHPPHRDDGDGRHPPP